MYNACEFANNSCFIALATKMGNKDEQRPKRIESGYVLFSVVLSVEARFVVLRCRRPGAPSSPEGGAAQSLAVQARPPP